MSDSVPVYLRVKRDVEGMIDQGLLAGGALVPSDRDLARRFGASLVTVQRALNMLAAEGKVQRVSRKGTIVSPTSRPTPMGRSTWAVIVPTMEYFYPPIVHTIEDEARRRGTRIQLSCAGTDLSLERQLIEEYVAEGVSGIIIAPALPEDASYTAPGRRPEVGRPSDSLDYLGELPVPVVLIDRFGMESPSVAVDSVVKDDFAGMYQSTAHLIQHGYRKIVTFAEMPASSRVHEFAQRCKGYHAAMADHGLAIPDLPHVSSMDIDWNPELIRTCLNGGMEACVFGDDMSAAMMIRLLRSWNVRVPDDVAVIGFDDEPTCLATDPPLSSVRVPKDEMARKAVQMLAERIETGQRGNTRSIILKPTLIARASCGRHCSLATPALAPRLAMGTSARNTSVNCPTV